MRKRICSGVLAAAVALVALPSPAAEAPSQPALLKRSPQFKGLARRYKVIAIEEGDLDGDGSRDWVAAFVSRKKGCQRGGFAIFSFRGGKVRVEWVGLYMHSRPENLTVNGAEISASVATEKGRVHATLKYGKDFWYRAEKQSPFAGMKIRASSQVAKGPRAASLAPANLIDGDPDTVWSTAAVGTGVGEWVEIEFAKPVDLGMIGVIGGDYRSKAQWKDSNRLFRFEVVAETTSDRTTMVEDKDITSMLKLPNTSKHINGVAKDLRRTKWVEIREREVVSIKLQAASVYLGEKNDDLFMSEIDLGVLLPDPKDDAPPKPPKAEKVPAPVPAPAK
jgi:hypothetical protein